MDVKEDALYPCGPAVPPEPIAVRSIAAAPPPPPHPLLDVPEFAPAPAVSVTSNAFDVTEPAVVIARPAAYPPNGLVIELDGVVSEFGATTVPEVMLTPAPECPEQKNPEPGGCPNGVPGSALVAKW